MHIFNLSNRPYLIVTDTEILFRESPSDKEMKRHYFSDIEKISVEHRYNANKELFLWLKIKMLSKTTPLLVQVSFLDIPVKELLSIFSVHLENKVDFSFPTAQWIDKKVAGDKKFKRIISTVILLLLAVFLFHKMVKPDINTLSPNALKKRYDKSYDLCSTKARIALKTSDVSVIDVRSYCGVLGSWQEIDKKSIPSLHLETEFSSLKDSDYILQATQAYDQNQTQVAREQISKALYRNPNNAQAYLLLTRIEYKSGSKDKALNSLKKAATLNPDSAAVFSALSMFHLEEEAYKQAYPYAKKAVELEANSKNFIRLARIEKRLGKKDEAIKYFERALYEDSLNSYILNELGLLYWQTNNFDKAAQRFKKAYNNNPDKAFEFLNYYEVSLVTPTPLGRKEKDNFLKHYQDAKDKMIAYEMLNIIHLSIKNEEVTPALDQWERTYKDKNLQWSFKEIRTWLDNSDFDVEHKQHIQNTIGFFTGHQRAYKMRQHTAGITERLK